jgi:hypothetical protein
MSKYETLFRFRTKGEGSLLIEGLVDGVQFIANDSRVVLLSWEQWYALRNLTVYKPLEEEPSDESPTS